MCVAFQSKSLLSSCVLWRSGMLVCGCGWLGVGVGKFAQKITTKIHLFNSSTVYL